jgi:translation initiation factor 2B subunit (eIF-2B alpha/beta/delta family)
MPEKFTQNYIRKSGKNADSVLESKNKKKVKGALPTEMELINLRYDLTPCKFLSMVICELGNIPPHSVPVVIKEMAKYGEGDE